MIIKIYPLICLKSLEITVLFTLWISLLELYKLPDIKDYDVLIFQTNSNFYKDYRQQMIDEAHKYHIPVVSINDPIKDCVCVGTDNQQAIYKLTQTILAEKIVKK